MKDLTPWIHKVQYYETDGMKIVHHSVYIRWLEEGRMHMLEEMGTPYDKIEAAGVMSPVVGVECKYKRSAVFGDTVLIYSSVEKFDGIRLTIHYDVRRQADGELLAEGTSHHCFQNTEGQLISLKRSNPDLYQMLLTYSEQ